MNAQRNLPAQPSLEHLRKEAKQELAALRLRAGSTQLADAQLLVARTYGFSSWRAMKLEVDRRRGVPQAPAILGDLLIPRPLRARGRALVQDSERAEQTFFGVVALPFLATPAAKIAGLIIAFLLG